MLVFIGLILVYGLLFAILAVSKAILDKDKKPPTSSKSTTQSSSKKPAYTVKTVQQRRSTVDEDAWILLQSRTKPVPPPARRSPKPAKPRPLFHDPDCECEDCEELEDD